VLSLLEFPGPEGQGVLHLALVGDVPLQANDEVRFPLSVKQWISGNLQDSRLSPGIG